MGESISIMTNLVLAEAAGAGVEAPKVMSAEIQSVWDFMLKGGPLMIPIGICSLVALTIVVERLVSLRRRQIIPPAFLPGLKPLLENDLPKALEYCESSQAPVATIIATGIRRLSEPIELMEKHIQDAGERVMASLRRHLRALSVIASICPLMGLLGTIFGMIKAFQTVATSGEALGKTELLAEGIYQAMITTAAGLLVAIPVIIAYHWIASKTDRLIDEMDHVAMEFVEEYAIAGEERPRNRIRLQSGDDGELPATASAAQS